MYIAKDRENGWTEGEKILRGKCEGTRRFRRGQADPLSLSRPLPHPFTVDLLFFFTTLQKRSEAAEQTERPKQMGRDC